MLFDSLDVHTMIEEAGLPEHLCRAACELVADRYNDSVDGMQLPTVLVDAGISAADAVLVHGTAVQNHAVGVAYQDGVYPAAALISAMQAYSVTSEAVEYVASQVVPAFSPLLSNGVSLPLITELLRSESLPNGRVDILVVNAIKKHIKGM